MLKGIDKNLRDNYTQLINYKRKDQIKSKDDVPVVEAFELYMLKNFHNIKLNSLTSRMLNLWEKDFDKSIFEHIEFFKQNKVEIEKSDMSFSVTTPSNEVEYCGKGLNGMFSSRKNLFNLKFLKKFVII